VPYWLIEPEWPDNGSEFISHYKYMPSGGEVRLDPDDVIHFRHGIDPANLRKGLAPLKAVLREVFTDNEAASFAASMLANGGVPGLVITPKEGSGGGAFADEVKDYVRNKFSGEHRGEPMAFSKPTEVKEFGYDPQKMDLGRIRNIPEERVTASLGVPAAVVGLGTGIQKATENATMQTLREMAYENGIMPLNTLIADELHSQLLPDFEPNPDEFRVRHDISEIRVLQEDQNKLIERLNAMVQGGWLTVAEAQRRAGFEADETQETYLRPTNLVSTPAGKMYTGMKQAGESTEAGESFIDDMNQRRERVESRWADDQASRFRALGEEIARVYQESIVKQDAEDERDAQRIVDNVDWEEKRNKALAYETLYLEVAQQTVESMQSTLGVAVNLTDEREAAVLARAGTRKGLVDLSGQTKDAVFAALKQGREAGKNPEEIARAIRQYVSGRHQFAGIYQRTFDASINAGNSVEQAEDSAERAASRARARRIARTEGRFAQNVSTLEMGREAEAVAYRIIDAQLPDDRPHTDSCGFVCQELDGMVVAESDVEHLMSCEHPNGTRDFVPQFDPEIEVQPLG
jgi:HK97 family phage portal protein